MTDRPTGPMSQVTNAEQSSTSLGTKRDVHNQAPKVLFDEARRIGFSDEELMQLSHIYLNAFAFDHKNRSHDGGLEQQE